MAHGKQEVLVSWVLINEENIHSDYVYITLIDKDFCEAKNLIYHVLLLLNTSFWRPLNCLHVKFIIFIPISLIVKFVCFYLNYQYF